jgi:hypothetical protein
MFTDTECECWIPKHGIILRTIADYVDPVCRQAASVQPGPQLLAAVHVHHLLRLPGRLLAPPAAGGDVPPPPEFPLSQTAAS